MTIIKCFECSGQVSHKAATCPHCGASVNNKNSLLDKNSILLEEWKTAIDVYKHIDDLVWRMFQYLITINGILISALVIFMTNNNKDLCTIKFVCSIISLFGAIFSMIWLLSHERQRLYQKYRIFQAREIEKKLKLNDERLLTLFDKGLNEQNILDENIHFWAKRSILKLISLIALIIFILWISSLIYFLK